MAAERARLTVRHQMLLAAGAQVAWQGVGEVVPR
jgi:hypothetical protein